MAGVAGLLWFAPVVLAAFPGRNGRLALERRNPDCRDVSGLFSVRPGGRDLRQLTSWGCRGPFHFGPAWSPDGRWILYREADESASAPLVAMMRPDGSDRTEVGRLAVTSYSWAPDGRRLSWDFDDGIFVGTLDKPREQRIAQGEGSAWAPNGQRLAVAQNCVDPFFCTRLALFDAETGVHQRTLIRNQGARSPDWAPNGRRIAYLGTGHRDAENASNYDVYVMRSDGRKRRRLTRGLGVSEVAWSPDGRWIAFTAPAPSTENRRDLWLMRPDGSDKRRIVKNVWDMSWQRRPKG
jgi:Tol biopolymer transport system component